MKYKLLSILLITIGFQGYAQFSSQYMDHKKDEYRAFIRNHPYSNPVEESSKEGEEEGPKPDRPDLANQLNFLQTLDPALGFPPQDGLAKAHIMAEKIARSKAGTKTAISGITWTERGPDNFGGRTRALMFDPNDGTGKTVFAGGVAGGLWKNTNITSSSNSWTSINDFWANLAVTCITYDPSNTQVMYAGTGEGFFNVDAVAGAGIWKSTNGGANWSQLSSTNNSTFTYVQKIAVHGTSGDIYACTRNNGVMRSQDGGSTWSKVLGSGTGASTNRAADVEIAADGTIFVSMGIFSTDGVYSSSTGNSGSWTKLNTGSNGFPSSGIRRIELACAPSNANVVYAVVQDNSNDIDGIYKTTNKGSSWSSLSLPSDADGGVTPDFTRNQAWYDLILAVDPNNANNVWTGGIDIFKSTNGGSSWSQVTHWYGGFGLQNVHADQHAMAFQQGSSTNMVFGNDGGVYYTSNASAGTPTVSSRNKGYNVTQFYAGGIHPSSGSNVMIAGAQDNGSHAFSSPGVNSTTEVTGGDGAFCHIDQTNGNNQISQYVYNVVYRTTNNWSGGNQISNDQTTGLFINPSDLDDNEDIYYSCRTNSTILRIKSVFGSTSSSSVSISGMSSKASHISVSPYSASGVSNIFIGTQAGDVFKVVNAHSTPTVTNITGTLPSGNISCIAIGQSDNQLMVTLSNYGVTSVWETTNGGTTWTSKEGNLPDMPVRWALYNPNDYNQAFIATEVGVWSTDNLSAGTVDWSPTNSGLANVRVDMLQYRATDNTVMAATHGRGVFTCVIPTGTKPVASFTSDVTTVCEGGTVNYTDQSTNTPTSWSWTFTGGTPSTSTSQNPSVVYNTAGTYQVRLIATNASGSDTSTVTSYVTVNSCGTTMLKPMYCKTYQGYGEKVACYPVSGAQEYEFEFTPSGGGSSIYYNRGIANQSFILGWVSGLIDGTKYDVRVRVKISGAFGSYGPIRQLTTPGTTTTTSVNSIYCNQTYASYADKIACYPVTNATDYEFEFVPQPSGPTVNYVTGGNNSFLLGAASSLTDNTTYNVRVRSKISGSFGPYGTTCQITTPAGQSVTSLKSVYCGNTYSSYADKLACYTVTNATDYEWRFTPVPSGTPITFSRGFANISILLNMVSGLQNNTAYNVDVRPKVGGVFQSYGPSCQITTPPTAIIVYGAQPGDNDHISGFSEMGLVKDEFTLYPNPNHGQYLFIEYRHDTDFNGEMFIFDLSGRMVESRPIKLERLSTESIKFMEQLTSGTYFIHLKNSKNHLIFKISVN